MEKVKYTDTFGKVVVRVAKKREDFVKLGDKEIFIDTSYKANHIRAFGEVLAVPGRLSDNYTAKEVDGEFVQGKERDLFEMDLMVGDTVYFEYVLNSDKDNEVEKTKEGFELMLPYSSCIGRKRDGKVKMLNNWFAVRPDQTEELETESGIVYQQSGKEIPGKGKVVYCCENSLGVAAGDGIAYNIKRRFKDKIDGEEFLLVQTHNVYGILEDA